ncbi:hypothetical protein Lal_00013772 [Lupinus albus]|nr:hypothetical protein Lal_00013772 [Lupinus albus]
MIASTIEIVDQINEYVMTIIPGEEKTDMSSDSIDISNSWTILPSYFKSSKKKGLKILIHDKDHQPLKTITDVIYK